MEIDGNGCDMDGDDKMGGCQGVHRVVVPNRWRCPTGGGARALADAMACMMADSCYSSDHNAW